MGEEWSRVFWTIYWPAGLTWAAVGLFESPLGTFPVFPRDLLVTAGLAAGAALLASFEMYLRGRD